MKFRQIKSAVGKRDSLWDAALLAD